MVGIVAAAIFYATQELTLFDFILKSYPKNMFHCCKSITKFKSTTSFLRTFTNTSNSFRFNETEAAKIAREDSRKALNLTHHDEIFDSENVYRLSRRKVTPGTEDQIKEYMEKTARRLRKVSGLIEVEVLVGADDSQTFRVLTHWQNSQKLADWVDSDLCHEVRTDLDNMLAEPVEVRTFRNFVEPTFTL